MINLANNRIERIKIGIFVYVSTGIHISVDSATNKLRKEDTPIECHKCVIGQTGWTIREQIFFSRDQSDQQIENYASRNAGNTMSKTDSE